MQLVVARTANDFSAPELRKRAKRGRPSATTYFRALDGANEAAFVALDVLPGQDFLVLYEIYLPRSQRGRGMGLRVMRAVEEHARSEGFRQIKVRPHPLDGSLDAERLRQWYIRQGYSIDDDDGELLTKVV